VGREGGRGLGLLRMGKAGFIVGKRVVTSGRGGLGRGLWERCLKNNPVRSSSPLSVCITQLIY
jgi:hypothetical protein